MGELKIKLPEDTERKFRKLAMARYGYAKGALSEAAKEAIQNWTFEDEITIEDPANEIKGLIKGIKKSSVELQHEAWDYITKKYSKKFKKRR